MDSYLLTTRTRYPWIQGHINDNHSTAQPHYYWQDLRSMIQGRWNHPSIYQWTLFVSAALSHPPSTVSGIESVRLTYMVRRLLFGDGDALAEERGGHGRSL
eukprot:COSAG01_NODE_21870_length_881_cov_1.843990_2_plen_101_part_00